MPLDEDARAACSRGLRDARASRRSRSRCCGRSSTREHEEAVGELLEAELPGVAVHPLAPAQPDHPRVPARVVGRDRRLAEAADAAAPARDGRATCAQAGFAGELLVVTSFGGVLHVDGRRRARPIYSVNSGPAMAPGRGQGLRRTTTEDVIVCDTGGTSFDVSVIRDGDIKFTRETWLGETFTGHITGLSSVDVKSIGAGGGSIAWIDSGGLLRVGPAERGRRSRARPATAAAAPSRR